MKKHNMELSYKDLHAIKHGLQQTIYRKQEYLGDVESQILSGAKTSEEENKYNESMKQDLEHETKLLERITERINYIKDKYKI